MSRSYPAEQSFRLEGHYGSGYYSSAPITMYCYFDYEEYQDYYDVFRPINFGRRHVQEQEWDDYILEAQLDWVEHLAVLEIDHKQYNREYANKV